MNNFEYECVECHGRVSFIKVNNGYAVYQCKECMRQFTLKMLPKREFKSEDVADWP